MARKSRKSRKGKGQSSTGKSGSHRPSDLVKQLKTNWKAGEWEKALVSYRTWCNRSGGKRDPRIEGELLFRASSSCCRKKQFEKAAVLLAESEKVYPENRKNILFCKGIALARSGQLEDSENIFNELGNSYHEYMIASIINKGKLIPESIALDPAFQQNMILKFWQNLHKSEADPTPSTALNNLKDAYTNYTSGKDPFSKLGLLENKTGFESIAVYLELLVSASCGRKIKVRNILLKNADVFNKGKGDSLLEIYLKSLLNKKEYKEILVLNKLLRTMNASPPSSEVVLNTALFYLALGEIEQGAYKKALDYYRRITIETPNVLHNKALLFQKTGNFTKANEFWTILSGKSKKPRRSDSEKMHISYGIMLKNIAGNYRHDSLPGKAIPLYKEVLTHSANDLEALEALQEIHTEEGNRQLSLNYAKQLYEIDKNNDEYLFNYSSALLELDRVNELLPLYTEALKRNPDNRFYKEGLEFCYVKMALDIRKDSMEELKVFVEKLESLSAVKSYRLVYLEGYILHREGYPRKALKRINKAMGLMEEHYEEYHLACILYEDEFIKQAIHLFRNIASCGCPTSDSLTESTVGFLVSKDDRENAFVICEIAENSLLWDDNFIAEMFYNYKKPLWAVEYSARLVKQEDADEEDRFLHLLILNDIGNGTNTLQYAMELQTEAKSNEDKESAYVFKWIIKQLKTKGKFKPLED